MLGRDALPEMHGIVTRKDIDITDDQPPRQGERLFHRNAPIGIAILAVPVLTVGLVYGIYSIGGYWGLGAFIAVGLIWSGIMALRDSR